MDQMKNIQVYEHEVLEHAVDTLKLGNEITIIYEIEF